MYRYLHRIDTEVGRNLYGQYMVTLTCRTCHKSGSTFDIFADLTLSIAFND
jgi:ubiquitin C-terminal hydrolase